jgi:hypothetical protein
VEEADYIFSALFFQANFRSTRESFKKQSAQLRSHKDRACDKLERVHSFSEAK